MRVPNLFPTFMERLAEKVRRGEHIDELEFESAKMGDEMMDEFMKNVRRHTWERGRKPLPAKPSKKALDFLGELVPEIEPTQMWHIGNEIEDDFWRDLEAEFGPAPQYKGGELDIRHVPPAANVEQGPI